MKIQYREFEDSVMLAMGKGDENHGRKNQTNVFDFFGRDFRHPIFPINSLENLKF